MDRVVARRAYTYLLNHEVDGSDRENLVDSLEDEEFPIRELLGEAEMVRQIRGGQLELRWQGAARLPWFAQCLEVLSVHLSEYILGLEIEEGWNAEGTRVQIAAYKHAACRGEVIRVPLEHRIEWSSGEITPGDENTRWLEEHFGELPRWAQDAYRIKFPELRRL